MSDNYIRLHATVDLFAELQRRLEVAQNAYDKSPNQAAFAVIVAAEMVAHDGYQPTQRTLNKLREAIKHYREVMEAP